MRCLVTKGQRETPKHNSRETERQRREEETGTGGRKEKKDVTQIAFTRFSYIYLKQIFAVTGVQATGCEISPSAQAPEAPIQTLPCVHQSL